MIACLIFSFPDFPAIHFPHTYERKHLHNRMTKKVKKQRKRTKFLNKYVLKDFKICGFKQFHYSVLLFGQIYTHIKGPNAGLIIHPSHIIIRQHVFKHVDV